MSHTLDELWGDEPRTNYIPYVRWIRPVLDSTADDLVHTPYDWDNKVGLAATIYFAKQRAKSKAKARNTGFWYSLGRKLRQWKVIS